MATPLPTGHALPVPPDELPRRTATEVKNQWGAVLREVQQRGGLAVTSHSNVELVMLDVGTYQRMVDGLQKASDAQQSRLDELTARFDARLAVLQAGDAARKVDDVAAARGRLKRRPRAGESF